LTNGQKQRPGWEKYWLEIVVFLAGIAAVNAIFISKAFRQSTTVDAEYAGWLGSFVGGYVGPIFALGGILLLIATLKNQQRSFAEQNFETKYFELLKMHRDNVTEIGIKSGSGRKVFVLLIRELRCALDIVKRIARAHDQDLTPEQLLHVAYYCLFYGVGPNSSRMLKMSLSTFNNEFIDATEKELNKRETKEEVQAERKFEYVPFEGHQSRLGHYYRHLYQMVRYVDERALDIDKYEYVKTIRAQLSTHEQALLLVNSLTPIGQNWWTKNLIVKYRLVQNIPREFFDSSTELDTGRHFESNYFEWEDGVGDPSHSSDRR
jgi:hypothetical protein